MGRIPFRVIADFYNLENKNVGFVRFPPFPLLFFAFCLATTNGGRYCYQSPTGDAETINTTRSFQTMQKISQQPIVPGLQEITMQDQLDANTTFNANPMFLTGVSNDATRELGRGDLYGRLGLMLGPAVIGHKCDYRPHIGCYRNWAMDNGCFTNAGQFDETKWLSSLDEIVNTVDGAADGCLFAVAPDVFDPQAGRGHALPTLERSAAVLPKIRAIGVPAALVFQDGLQDHIDAIDWDSFDVAFLGGSDAFKLGYPCRTHNNLIEHNPEQSERWARLMWTAMEHGKTIHVGRSNSSLRFNFCRALGADSADGTFVGFAGTKNGCRHLRKWLLPA